MGLFRSILSVAATAALFSFASLQGASATDRTIWEGFHFGGHLGSTNNDFDINQSSTLLLLNNTADDESAFTGGIVYGSSWQFNNWVVGTDSDWTWGHDGASGLATGVINIGAAAPIGPFTVNDIDIDYTSSTRVRVGHLITPSVLVYGTLGIAFAQVDISGTLLANGSDDERFFGVAYGGGIETTLPNRWFGRVEYLAFDYGDEDFADNRGGNLNIDLDSHTVRVAVGKRFDWSPLDLLRGGN